MYTFNVIFTKSTITNMTQHQFTYIGDSAFKGFSIVYNFRFKFNLLLNSRIYDFENLLYGLLIGRANPTDVALSWIHVEFNTGKASTILTAVVLLLHQ